MAFETQVGIYSNPNNYARDAKRLAQSGWVPISVTERRPRAGCLRIVTLGLWTLVFPPKPELVVTYQRGLLQQPPSVTFIAPSYPLPPTGAAYCPSCGALRAHGDAFCAQCGFGYQALPAPPQLAALPATLRTYDDPYGDAPNPYNLDPETGLPYKTPEQRSQSQQISRIVLWAMAALIVLAIVISLFE